jgi:hypothetical protein
MGTLAVTMVLRHEISASRAGRRGDAPGWCGRLGWRTGLPPSLEGLDDDHAPAAVDTVFGVKHQISLFRSDRGCRRAHCGQGQGAQSRAGLRPSLTSAAHAGLRMSDRDGGMISSQLNNGIGII